MIKKGKRIASFFSVKTRSKSPQLYELWGNNRDMRMRRRKTKRRRRQPGTRPKRCPRTIKRSRTTTSRRRAGRRREDGRQGPR